MGGIIVELKTLTAIPGVSGNEGKIRAKIIEEAKARGAEVRADRLGNVFAFKKGAGKGHILIAAHMDEVGFIVRGIRDDGLIAYSPVGAVDSRVVVSKPVRIGENSLPGVIGAKAIHLQSAEERGRVLSHGDMYIDIGAKDKQSAEKLVSPGDYVNFEESYVEFGAGLIKAKSLDDRVGVYNLLRLLENDYAPSITCAFTVQEEVGLIGARVAGRQVEADAAIVLEGTSANDIGGVPEHEQVCALTKGVAISFMDHSSIANFPLREALIKTAEAAGIKWQHKTYVSGGNDAGALQTARGALPVCVLSVPCRYIHSPVSVAAIEDINAQFALPDAYLRRL